MKNKMVLISALTIASLQFSSVYASGKDLHDTNCQTCHTDDVYKRADKKVKTLNGLASRVNICSKNAARVEWDKQQINSVTEYLNSRYYKF